jgi:hypothetical protein
VNTAALDFTVWLSLVDEHHAFSFISSGVMALQIRSKAAAVTEYAIIT